MIVVFVQNRDSRAGGILRPLTPIALPHPRLTMMPRWRITTAAWRRSIFIQQEAFLLRAFLLRAGSTTHDDGWRRSCR